MRQHRSVRSMKRDPLDVVALVYDGLCSFEFGCVAELFGLQRPEFERWYKFRVARVDDAPIRTREGISIRAPFSSRILETAGTIVVPGWTSIDTPVPTTLIRRLVRAHAEGARIVAVCTGAFVLAEAGLLDGRRATTHWIYSDALAERFPNVEVDPDVLYVDEGRVLTSAGSAAGIDLALHLISRDFGGAAANTVARRMVVPPHRDGGQKQYVDAPVALGQVETSIARVQESIRKSLNRPHDVAAMARVANMSPRTFARRFKESVGTTPQRWLRTERVALAKGLLENTSLSMEEVALRSGFSDAQVLRQHFKRSVGTSPSAYRRTFSA